MLSETITYDEAIIIVKALKESNGQKLLCIVVVAENCPFCEDMMENVMVKVAEGYKKDVDFYKLNITNEKSDNCIFPMLETPSFLFYLKGGDPFPALRNGAGPLNEVMSGIGNIVNVNKKINGANT